MKKIIVALLVPFAFAAAGCDRNESVMDQRSSVEQKRSSTTQGPNAATAPVPYDTTKSSSGTAPDTATIAQGPATTETPASKSQD